MDTRKRVAFMNSLSGFKSASLIGTIDNKNNTNLAIFSSVIHLGSNPALIGFINRPDTVDRHTFENILQSNCFTINHIKKSIYKLAHQTSARYSKDVSEFTATGLTPQFQNNFKAPFVQESHIKYGLEFIEKHDIKINGTILVIGKVIDVILPESCLLSDGTIDIEMAETIAISGLDSYHTTNKIARLSYAKIDKMPIELND
jgi:flavin reductase (DIM6/NTAB) family NADH-FMN oxidoreductase RutF